MNAMKNLFETDWDKELESQDKSTFKDGGDQLEVVLLSGLQRLARTANILRQSCVIQTPAPTMVQAIFTVTFITGDDGETATFVGTADCTVKNTTGKYANYPTAVAESRAEARCLRKALGIRMLSSEEVGFREGAGLLEASATGQANSQMVAAIETLCESRSIEPISVLEAVLSDTRALSVFEFSELTIPEAQEAMSWLNGKKAKPKAKLETRDARKKELKEKLQ